MSLLATAQTRLAKIAAENDWSEQEKVLIVSARDLTPEEAIGKPGRDDYPLLNGKEVMLEARLGEGIGQAFTAVCWLTIRIMNCSRETSDLFRCNGSQVGCDVQITADLFLRTLSGT